jgi:hypothetical protein
MAGKPTFKERREMAIAERGYKNKVTRAVGSRVQAVNPWSQTNKDIRTAHTAQIGAKETAKELAKILNKEEKKGNEGQVQAGGTGSVNLDEETNKGDSTLKDRLIDAIRKGQRRLTGMDTSDALIREVVCNPLFIDAIASRSVATPTELLDPKYENEMMFQRRRLASELHTASTRPDYIIGNISTFQLDIIIATMIGNTEIWENETRWSKGLKPHEALLKFVNRMAQEEDKNSPGTSSAKALKDLCLRPSFEETPFRPRGGLADSDYINNYLYKESAGAIERTAGDFQKKVTELLNMTASEIHAELQVPGIGYRTVYEATLAKKKADVAAAEGKANASRKAATDAEGMLVLLTNAKEEADKNGEAEITLPKGVVKIIRDDPRMPQALDDAMATLRAAMAETENTDAELTELKRDLYRYEDNTPENMARDLTETFKRRLLLARQTINENEISEFMADSVENPLIVDFLDQATELLGERERFVNLVEDTGMPPSTAMQIFGGTMAETAQRLLELEKQQIDVKKKAMLEMLGDKKKEFEDRAALFETAVTQAQLEETAKRPLLKLATSIKTYNLANDAIMEHMIKPIRETQAQPLRKVVPFALKGMKKRKGEDPFELTDDQKIVRRMTFEEYGEGVKGQPPKQQGLIGRKMDELLSWATRLNWAKVPLRTVFLHVLPGKQIFGSYDSKTKTYSGGHLMHPGQHYTWSDKDESGYNVMHVSKLRRWQVGLFWTVAKGYFLVPAIVGGILSSTGNYYPDEKSLIRPWTYFATLESERDKRMHVEDSYDLAWKLPDRGQDYYKFAYGVGKILPGEEGGKTNWFAANISGKLCGVVECDGPTSRLNWLQGNPDVLRFFQERSIFPWRRIPMVYNGWEPVEETEASTDAEPVKEEKEGVAAKVKQKLDLGETASSCSIPNKLLPDTCTALKNAHLTPTNETEGVEADPAQEKDATLGTWEFIKNYQPVRMAEGWKKEKKICCTINLYLEPIADNLVINKFESDKFVAELMRIEREGIRDKKIVMTYEFLNSPENIAQWVKKGFLMTKSEADLIETTKVTSRDSVIFLRTQGGSRIKDFEAMCGEIGEAESHVKEANRDAFVGLWMKKIEEMLPGVNLKIAWVPDDVLTATLNSTITGGAANGWVQNTKSEHERWQLATLLKGFDLETTALDTLVANPDIKELVTRFRTGLNGYYINTSRADEFVRVLAEHKAANGKIVDFDPSLSGSQVQWAIGGNNRDGYLYFEGSVPAAEGKMEIPKLTDEAKAFYASQQLFSDFLDGSISSLHEDGRADGKLAKEILWRVFKGDKAKMAESLRQGIYLELATVKDPQDYARESGITLKNDANGKLAGAEIGEDGFAKAGNALRARMLDTMKRIIPTEPMPVPQVTNESRAFYASQPEFATIVDEVISTLHGSESQNGKLMKSELDTVFRGEQERMDEVLREWVYSELASCEMPEAYAEATGILVVKAEDGALVSATVDGKNAKKTAEKAIRQRVVELLEWTKPADAPAAEN